MTDANAPIVLLVGHCFPDAMMLKSAVKRVIKGVNFEKAHSVGDLEKHLPGSSVALVNRVLDGSFESTDGIGLIRQFASHEAGTALLLVSNFPESQAEAEAAGAAPGFGKTDLYAAETAERILAAIAISTTGA